MSVPAVIDRDLCPTRGVAAHIFTTGDHRAERRRVERIQPSPLRVRLHRSCVGTLVNLSELGALVRLPTAQRVEHSIALQLEWNDETVLLSGRVLRSTPHAMQTQDAVLARIEHKVALEFRDLSRDALVFVKRIIDEHR